MTKREKKNNKFAHLKAPTSNFLTIKMKANNKGALIKRWNKDFVSSLVKRGERRMNPALVFTLASAALSSASRPPLCLPAGRLDGETRAPRRAVPGGQRSAYRFYSATKKLSGHTKRRLCPSVRLPLRQDVLASRNGRERTMVIGRWKDVAMVLKLHARKKKEASTRACVFMNDSCSGGATQKKRGESHFHLKAPSCSYHVWSHPRIKTGFDGQGK